MDNISLETFKNFVNGTNSDLDNNAVLLQGKDKKTLGVDGKTQVTFDKKGKRLGQGCNEQKLASRNVTQTDLARYQDNICLRGQLLTAVRSELGGETSEAFKEIEKLLFGDLQDFVRGKEKEKRFGIELGSSYLTVGEIKTVLAKVNGKNNNSSGVIGQNKNLGQNNNLINVSNNNVINVSNNNLIHDPNKNLINVSNSNVIGKNEKEDEKEDDKEKKVSLSTSNKNGTNKTTKQKINSSLSNLSSGGQNKGSIPNNKVITNSNKNNNVITNSNKNKNVIVNSNKKGVALQKTSPSKVETTSNTMNSDIDPKLLKEIKGLQKDKRQFICEILNKLDGQDANKILKAYLQAVKKGLKLHLGIDPKLYAQVCKLTDQHEFIFEILNKLNDQEATKMLKAYLQALQSKKAGEKSYLDLKSLFDFTSDQVNFIHGILSNMSDRSNIEEVFKIVEAFIQAVKKGLKLHLGIDPKLYAQACKLTDRHEFIFEILNKLDEQEATKMLDAYLQVLQSKNAGGKSKPRLSAIFGFTQDQFNFFREILFNMCDRSNTEEVFKMLVSFLLFVKNIDSKLFDEILKLPGDKRQFIFEILSGMSDELKDQEANKILKALLPAVKGVPVSSQASEMMRLIVRGLSHGLNDAKLSILLHSCCHLYDCDEKKEVSDKEVIRLIYLFNRIDDLVEIASNKDSLSKGKIASVLIGKSDIEKRLLSETKEFAALDPNPDAGYDAMTNEKFAWIVDTFFVLTYGRSLEQTEVDNNNAEEEELPPMPEETEEEELPPIPEESESEVPDVPEDVDVIDFSEEIKERSSEVDKKNSVNKLGILEEIKNAQERLTKHGKGMLGKIFNLTKGKVEQKQVSIEELVKNKDMLGVQVQLRKKSGPLQEEDGDDESNNDWEDLSISYRKKMMEYNAARAQQEQDTRQNDETKWAENAIRVEMKDAKKRFDGRMQQLRVSAKKNMTDNQKKALKKVEETKTKLEKEDQKKQEVKKRMEEKQQKAVAEARNLVLEGRMSKMQAMHNYDDDDDDYE